MNITLKYCKYCVFRQSVARDIVCDHAFRTYCIIIYYISVLSAVVYVKITNIQSSLSAVVLIRVYFKYFYYVVNSNSMFSAVVLQRISRIYVIFLHSQC